MPLLFIELENSQALDEMTRPVGTALNILTNPNFSLRRGCIDHPPATQVNTHMALEADDIAALQVVHIRNNRIFCAALPCRRGHIALANARLIEAVVYETGAIEYIWAFAA